MRSGRDSLPGRFSNDATVTESAGRGAAAAPCEGIAMTPCNPCICAGNPNTGIPIEAIMAARACMSASVAAFMPGGAVPACTCPVEKPLDRRTPWRKRQAQNNHEGEKANNGSGLHLGLRQGVLSVTAGCPILPPVLQPFDANVSARVYPVRFCY